MVLRVDKVAFSATMSSFALAVTTYLLKLHAPGGYCFVARHAVFLLVRGSVRPTKMSDILKDQNVPIPGRVFLLYLALQNFLFTTCRH